MSFLAELPAVTTSLLIADAPDFVAALGTQFSLDPALTPTAQETLLYCFHQYGGYGDVPSDPNGTYLSYHGGSHSAYVMAIGLYLAQQSGSELDGLSAVAVAAAAHDYYHTYSGHGVNETKSAEAIEAILLANNHKQIARLMPELIMGTVVERVDDDEIYQRAMATPHSPTVFIADADLAAFAFPNAGEWALKLYDERTPRVKRSQVGARAFLLQTVHLQRNHKYISEAGKALLTSLAQSEADRLVTRIDKLIAPYPIVA
jgi:hypothetical protein